MTRDQAIELARHAAVRIGPDDQAYQPLPSEADTWAPHDWIITALIRAYDIGWHNAWHAGWQAAREER